MRNRYITGIGFAILGLLIALGPQFIFKICSQEAEEVHGAAHTNCYWLAQSEIGAGAMLAALGIAYLLSRGMDVRRGLSVALFLNSAVVLLNTGTLLKFCSMEDMACRLSTVPALTIIGVAAIVGAAGNTLWLAQQRRRDAM